MPRVLLVLFVVLVPATANAQFHPDPVARALQEFQWEFIEEGGVRTYYREGTFAERHRHMLLRSARAALQRSLQYAGVAHYPDTLRVFYIDSRADMEELVGRPVSGLASTAESGVFLVVNPEWRAFDVHEITHVVSLGTWGAPHDASRWMIEGISIASDGWCRVNSVDQIARHLLERGDLLRLREFFPRFRDLGEVPGGMYAASVIDYIRDHYGIDAVRALWQQGSNPFEAAVGVTVEDVEAAWQDHLRRTVPDDVHVDYDAIDQHGCG